MIERHRPIRREDDPDNERDQKPERTEETAEPIRRRGARPGRSEEPERKPPDLDAAIIQAKLTVGPAGDAYEREADAVAADVVSTLQSSSAPVHEPATTDAAARTSDRAAPDLGGGDDGTGDGSSDDGETVHVGGGRLMRRTTSTSTPGPSIRRIQRSAMATPIGAQGGELDDDTHREIESRRSGGSPLPDVARSTMESAFGADFSAVRVHTGSAAADLNDRIEAKAFTTGQDIFFRDGVPDVSSSAGQELLAHELTHTIQQGAALQRSSVIMRRWWPFGKKKAGSKMEIGEPSDAQLNGGDIEAELERQGYSGISGSAPSSAGVEAGKPGAAVTVAGGAAAGAAFGKGGEAGASGIDGVADVALAGGVGGGILGALTAGDAAFGLNNARKMHNEAEQFDDAAMGKMASSKAKDQGTQLAVGLVNTGKGAATIADVYSGSTAAVAQGGAEVAGTAVAAGGLGVAAGGVMVLQGSWRGGKAIMKLCRLTYGRAQTMLSAEGKRWKEVFVNAEQWKVAVNAFKVVAGGLGVAAGALVIVGSPVGWILGLSAAIAAGIYAGAKIAGKVSNARAKSKARDEDAAQLDVSAPIGASQLQPMGDGSYAQGYVDLPSMGYDMSQVRQAGPQNEPDRGTGLAKPDDGDKDDDTLEREAAIAEADRLAARASKNARIAGEVREALGRGDGAFIDAALKTAQHNPNALVTEMITEPDDQRLHDAFVLLSSVNIDPDEALAASGQLLIEQKLSTAEAM